MGKPITTLQKRPRGLTRVTPSDTLNRLSGTGFIYTFGDGRDSFLTPPFRPLLPVLRFAQVRAMAPLRHCRRGASKNAPTRFLQDIMRQPAEMQRAIEYLTGTGQDALQQASALIRSVRHVVVTGIGASWNAALSAGALFDLGARPVYMQEAGELLHGTAIPRGAVIIAISRTGRSIEIVQLLAKAEASGARIIGITNSADSPLARESAVAIVVPTKLDHGISVNAYSTLLIAASALASSATAGFASVAASLLDAIGEAGKRLDTWREQLEESGW